MEETYSIARARDELASLVHRVEKRRPVVLTRRGKPVAVLMSFGEYSKLRGGKGFVDSLESFRERHAEHLADLADAFDDLRDSDPGREVDL